MKVTFVIVYGIFHSAYRYVFQFAAGWGCPGIGYIECIKKAEAPRDWLSLYLIGPFSLFEWSNNSFVSTLSVTLSFLWPFLCGIFWVLVFEFVMKGRVSKTLKKG